MNILVGIGVIVGGLLMFAAVYWVVRLGRGIIELCKQFKDALDAVGSCEEDPPHECHCGPCVVGNNRHPCQCDLAQKAQRY